MKEPYFVLYIFPLFLIHYDPNLIVFDDRVNVMMWDVMGMDLFFL